MVSNNADRNISPRPQWSFAEVVEHAWQVYGGSGIESGGRRNVLFRVWAAMVGSQRAVAELDHYIQQQGSLEAAATAMGCKPSTVRTLRKQFSVVDDDPLSPVSLALAEGERLRGQTELYEVEGRLGSGGMSVVYRVHTVKGSEKYAAKVLSTERFAITNIVRDRFLRESRLAQNLTSARVVRSVESLHHRGTLVSIMELLSGRTLYETLLKPRETISPSERLKWLVQITEGVAYLHKNEIVHRDLSPRNCLFRDDESLAIGDFGVARRTDDFTLTTFHERMGSLIYISPQQREDPHSARFTDDVFALGQIAYHVLSGQSPHGGVERLSDLGYPTELETWVRALRNPDAARRPESAVECLTSLNTLRTSVSRLPETLPAAVA